MSLGMSEVSERANKWAQRSKRMSEQCEQMSNVREKNGKITAAWIWTKFVVSIANGVNKYQPKFQLSSSKNLGDMPFFVTKIEDQKGDRFLHLLVENLTHAEIA